MAIKEFIKKYRNIFTILLAFTGIGIMAYYDYCDTACSYLRGDIFGIDLKWIGITYMSAIIIFVALRQADFVRALLAAGLGVEVFLFTYQLRNDVFCPFCLAFAATVIAAFIVNYEESPAWLANQRKMWIYFLGEVNFPMFKIKKLPLVVVALIGYFFILFTFYGSTTPVYGQDNETVIPSLGRGQYEVLMFSNYFCPPCRRIDAKAEPLMKELLGTGKVKITFVDVPFHKNTAMYANAYLAAINAGADDAKILQIRKILFEAAQDKRIDSQDALIQFMRDRNIAGKSYDVNPVFAVWSELIKKHKVDRTPTCFIKYPTKEMVKYIGDKDIWKGLMNLKAHLRK